MKPLAALRAVVLTHSYATGPAQELVAYLRPRVPLLVFIDHPFPYSQDTRSSLTIWRDGERAGRRVAPAFRGAPEILRYVKDFVLTLWYLSSLHSHLDVCFAADNLNALAALVARALGWVSQVVFYTIDYVPQRFASHWLNVLYLWMDRFCCRHADFVWNVSLAMAEARAQRGLPPEKCAPQIVVPLGNNFQRIERLPLEQVDRYALAFLGHLRPLQGIELVLEALPAIRQIVPEAHLIVVGGGPLLEPLRERAQESGLQPWVTFHGMVEEHTEVERILARCSIGLAPYEPAPDSFTPFADPGKPKVYLACGLPVLITDVPCIARQIAEAGAGCLIEYTHASLRDTVVELLTDEQVYRGMRERATELGARFDWSAIFADALTTVGISV